MKARLTAIVLLLMCAPTMAMTGADYLEHCQRTSTYDRAHCMGYLDALLGRDAEPESGGPRRPHDTALGTARPALPYCLPTGIQLPLLRDVVVRMLRPLPAARLNEDAAPLIRAILARTYPPHATCAD